LTLDAGEAVRAAAASHLSWLRARARGAVRERAGGLLGHVPGEGTPGRLEVLFVERPEQEPAAVADEVLDWIAALPPLASVGWWAEGTASNASLAPVLLARGFQWGWRPHWMALELRDPVPDFPPPPGVVVAPLSPGGGGPDLPPSLAGHRALAALPGTTVFAAADGARVLGAVALHVGGGPPGPPPAGLYDCFVEPPHRRRGIGASLTAAAAARARAMGCRLAVLNATEMGRGVYARAGFCGAGWGQTWWLVEHQLRMPRPEPEAVRFVEAVGRGDPEALDAALARLRGRPGGFDLDAELPCRQTPLGVAAALGRPESALRLLARGARPDPIAAWDLGWREEAEALLRRPGEADRPRDERGATALMIAAERGDEALARAVLAAGPDLGRRDRLWQADALGWAEHLGQEPIAALIREHGAGGGPPSRQAP
jgi:GNAT superfamily N-acetyltransferase